MKLLYAFLCLSIGCFLAYSVKRRRFNRTNRCGVEEFGSYAKKAMAATFEKFFWNVALILIAAGIFFVVVG